MNQVISVSVGMPRPHSWRGKELLTGIFKLPVQGRVPVTRLGLQGDGQANLKVHGGPDRAAYLYPAEHLDAWRSELPDLTVEPGIFGENLLVTGIREDTVRIGDRLRARDVLFEVSQPRLPCQSLVMRLGRDINKRFIESGRLGFYLRVVREGSIAAGDLIEVVPAAGDSMTIREIAALYLASSSARAALVRAAALPALSALWRDRFKAILAESRAE